MDYEDHISKVLQIVAIKMKINNWRYIKKSFGKNILNHMSDISPFVLIDEHRKISTDLVVKSDPRLTHSVDLINEIFNREVYFYTTLVPIISRTIGEESLKGGIPECYYAESSEENRVLVLKDMRSEGFVKHDNGIYLDQDHVLVILRAIAKFHSLSMILDHRKIKLPDVHILKSFHGARSQEYLDVYQCFFKTYLFLFKGMECETYIKKICDYVASGYDFINACVSKARRLVYIHGDMWKENFLFKYSGLKPVQVCLVDFQLTGLSCPAVEFLLVIMNSTESSVRRLHYHSFASSYYQSLRTSLQSHGLDPEEVYSEEDFNHDLRLAFLNCFCWAFISFLLWLNIETSEAILLRSTCFPKVPNKSLLTFKNIVNRLYIDFKDFGILTPLQM